MHFQIKSRTLLLRINQTEDAVEAAVQELQLVVDSLTKQLDESWSKLASANASLGNGCSKLPLNGKVIRSFADGFPANTTQQSQELSEQIKQLEKDSSCFLSCIIPGKRPQQGSS